MLLGENFINFKAPLAINFMYLLGDARLGYNGCLRKYAASRSDLGALYRRLQARHYKKPCDLPRIRRICFVTTTEARQI